jgi:hypothetical protein
MIDRTVFRDWIVVLCEKFNKPLSPPSQLVFYDIVNAELTTEEFVVGARLVFRDNQFFPSPKDIIDKAKPAGDPAIEAADVFRDILTWNGAENLMAEARRRLTDVGLRAFLAVGGPGCFRRLTVDQEVWARKEFIARYVEAKKDAEERGRVDLALADSQEARIAAHRDRVNNTLAARQNTKRIVGPSNIADEIPAAMASLSGGRTR